MESENKKQKNETNARTSDVPCGRWCAVLPDQKRPPVSGTETREHATAYDGRVEKERFLLRVLSTVPHVAPVLRRDAVDRGPATNGTRVTTQTLLRDHRVARLLADQHFSSSHAGEDAYTSLPETLVAPNKQNLQCSCDALFTVRAMTKDDIEQVLEIQVESFDEKLWESREHILKIADLFAEGCVVAELQGGNNNKTILGYALSFPWYAHRAVHNDEVVQNLPEKSEQKAYFVHDLAVRSSARGKGVARTLAVHVADCVPRRCGLHTHVSLVAVQGACKFWSRFGFSEVPHTRLSALLRCQVSSYGSAGVAFMQKELYVGKTHTLFEELLHCGDGVLRVKQRSAEKQRRRRIAAAEPNERFCHGLARAAVAAVPVRVGH